MLDRLHSYLLRLLRLRSRSESALLWHCSQTFLRTWKTNPIRLMHNSRSSKLTIVRTCPRYFLLEKISDFTAIRSRYLKHLFKYLLPSSVPGHNSKNFFSTCGATPCYVVNSKPILSIPKPIYSLERRSGWERIAREWIRRRYRFGW